MTEVTMPSWTRRLRRDDRGSSLIETVVALGIIVVVMLALLSTTANLTLASYANRTRTEATSIGNQFMETARTLSFGNLKVLNDGGFAAPNNVDGDGNPVQLCTSPCNDVNGQQLPYLVRASTVTQQGVPFTVNQAVYGVDDPSDGTGAGDTTGTVDYKKVVVKVTWARPKPGTFAIETTVRNTDIVPQPIVAGIRAEIVDASGDLVSDTGGAFDVTFTGTNGVSSSGTAYEGVFQDFDLPDGTYTCTVSSTSFQKPGVSPPVNSQSRTVTVAASSQPVGLCQTEWEPVVVCATSAADGIMNVLVNDESGLPVPNAVVRLFDGNGTAVAAPAGEKTANAQGIAVFTVPAGPYSAIGNASTPSSPVTLVNDSAKASGCIAASSSISVTATGQRSVVTTGGTLSFAVTLKNSTGGRQDYQVTVTRAGATNDTRSLNLDRNRMTTLNYNNTAVGSYKVEIFAVTAATRRTPARADLLYSWTQVAPPVGTDFTNSAGKSCALSYEHKDRDSVASSVSCP